MPAVRAGIARRFPRLLSASGQQVPGVDLIRLPVVLALEEIDCLLVSLCVPDHRVNVGTDAGVEHMQFVDVCNDDGGGGGDEGLKTAQPVIKRDRGTDCLRIQVQFQVSGVAPFQKNC